MYIQYNNLGTAKLPVELKCSLGILVLVLSSLTSSGVGKKPGLYRKEPTEKIRNYCFYLLAVYSHYSLVITNGCNVANIMLGITKVTMFVISFIVVFLFYFMFDYELSIGIHREITLVKIIKLLKCTLTISV